MHKKTTDENVVSSSKNLENTHENGNYQFARTTKKLNWLTCHES